MVKEIKPVADSFFKGEHKITETVAILKTDNSNSRIILGKQIEGGVIVGNDGYLMPSDLKSSSISLKSFFGLVTKKYPLYVMREGDHFLRTIDIKPQTKINIDFDNIDSKKFKWRFIGMDKKIDTNMIKLILTNQVAKKIIQSEGMPMSTVMGMILITNFYSNSFIIQLVKPELSANPIFNWGMMLVFLIMIMFIATKTKK